MPLISFVEHLTEENEELKDALKRLYESANEDYDPYTSSNGLKEALIRAEELLCIPDKDRLLE